MRKNVSSGGLVPITERWADSNSYIALMFLEGMVFARIVRRERNEYEAVNVTDETGASFTVGPQAASSEYIVKDPRDSTKTLLGGTNLTEKTSKGYAQILHGAIGINPSHMRVYTRMPAKSGVLHGLIPQISSPVVANGDRLASFNGNTSPYNMPSNAVEMVIIPKVDVSLQFFNDYPANITGLTNDAIRPTLRYRFMRYFLEILRPYPGELMEQLKGAPLTQKIRAKRDHRIIKKCMFGEFDESGIFKFLPVGWGDTLVSMDNDLQRQWGVRPITDDEALSLPEVAI